MATSLCVYRGQTPESLTDLELSNTTTTATAFQFDACYYTEAIGGPTPPYQGISIRSFDRPGIIFETPCTNGHVYYLRKRSPPPEDIYAC